MIPLPMRKPDLPENTPLPPAETRGATHTGGAAQPTALLAERLRQHAGRIQSLRRRAPILTAVTDRTDSVSSSAGTLLMRVLAALPDGERRKHPRLVINARVFCDRQTQKSIGLTRNIGAGGVLMSFHSLGPDIIQFMALGGTLTVEGLGSITARIARLEEDAAFLAFDEPLDPSFDAALRVLTAEMQQRHAPFLTLSGVMAERMQNVLIGQIVNGEAKLEEVFANLLDRDATPAFPPTCEKAVRDVLQSEIETLDNVSWVLTLHREGNPICSVQRKTCTDYHITFPNSASREAMFPEHAPEFGTRKSVFRDWDMSHADAVSLAFAARISPVPSVQRLSSIISAAGVANQHMASSPVYVLGRRWGAVAVIYDLRPEIPVA
jgi:hypothetical protein